MASRDMAVGKMILSALLFFGVSAAGAVTLVRNFPFRRDALIRRLEQRTGVKLTIGSFRERWFPPGFDAGQVRVTDREGDVLNIGAMRLECSYAGLLRNPATLDRIEVKGLRLAIDTKAGAARQILSSKVGVVIGAMRIEDGAIDVSSGTDGKPPVEFLVHSLTLHDLGPDRNLRFEVALHNPKPSGEVRARGTIGSLDAKDPGHASAAGDFTFTNADLTADDAITGLLNASGQFHGPLKMLAVKGTADVPRFEVRSSNHTVHIAARFDTTVNAMDGSAALNEIVTHFDRTTVTARGTVANDAGRPGKTLTVNATVEDGRVEDLVKLFSRDTPGMQGAIRFQARFTIPPGPPDFLTKLRAEGEFAIRHARFTNPNAQAPVNRLSASAEGESKQEAREHPVLATAEIHGRVMDRNGVARLTHVVFATPGVQGELAGTFALKPRNVDLNGKFETSGKLADTTSGFKALIVKAMGPLWPKKGKVKEIPFTITGRAGHPVFHLKLRD
ncbi:MAG TPA: AsmA-like C-terminal region-containing protein [Bryobacteraceae bacterium]|nr:AsmA-like C-terminal region-containing protein [Bryobacteraceae bacterium]